MNICILILKINSFTINPPVGESELIFPASVSCRTGVKKENQFAF